MEVAPAAEYRFLDIISGRLGQVVSGNKESGAGRVNIDFWI
jgi:hypothetical protein